MKLVDFRRLASPQFARKNPVLSRKYPQLRANSKSVRMYACVFDLLIRQHLKARIANQQIGFEPHVVVALARAVRISCNFKELKLVSLDCQAGLAMLKAIPDNRSVGK